MTHPQRGSRDRARGAARAFALVVLVTAWLTPNPSHAQGGPFGYGVNERFAAAKELVILGVQQAISDLPPTSGQTFTYEYDRAIDAYVRSDRPGPASFYAPETIGEGMLDLRSAVSYFELSKSFRPIDYLALREGQFSGYTKVGLDVGATVEVVSLAATWGLAPDLDLSLTVPIAVVDASASTSITTCQPAAAEARCGTPPNPPIYEATVIGVASRERLDAPGFLRGEDPLIYQRSATATEFSASGRPVPFSEGTHVGLGRVALALKKAFRPMSIARAALFTQVALPSPNEDQFAGSDSAGLMARVVTSVDATGWLRVLSDVGYEYDTSFQELRRFIWDVGLAASISRATFDAGFGGSVYAQPIVWTPSQTTVADPATRETTTLTALESNQAGTNYAAVRAGFRVRLTDTMALSGTVAIPITDDTFSPDATGTLALDYSF